ncbi:hypothetical protein JCM11251_004405 [Rhodosporidiobolus azoricus]
MYSADDTCAAVVDSNRQIMSNVVLKQSSIHESFGGIHPLHAQEAHQVNMPVAIQRALSEANVSLDALDGIAFTRGPGMYGCLSVCAGAAKALAAATGKPLLGVHHMQAHALTPFLTATPNSPFPTPQFPFLTLLLSGGHTLLLHASSPSSFRILATTHDESIGACLDKASRDLGIDWALGGGSPGAALEKFAFPTLSLKSRADGEFGATTEADEPSFQIPSFPTPFPRQLAFSYAGLRSSLTRIISPNSPSTTSTSSSAPPVHPSLTVSQKRSLARSFMLAAFRQIEDKVALALKGAEERGEERFKGLVVSGGVASNLILRERLRIKLDSLGYPDMPLIFPPPKYCTDNAAMIAHIGIQRLLAGRTDPLTVMQRSKWSVEECEADFDSGKTGEQQTKQ